MKHGEEFQTEAGVCVAMNIGTEKKPDWIFVGDMEAYWELERTLGLDENEC